jgi:chromosome segregation ATPase
MSRNTASPRQDRLKAWSAVLDQVQATLQEAVAATHAREQRLQEVPSEVAAKRQQKLQEIQARCQTLASAGDQAAQRAAAAEAALAEAEEALRRWLQKAEGAQNKLAAWAGGTAA